MSFILIFILSICSDILAVKNVEIKTSLGPIRGKVVDDIITGAFYHSFEGMPYAEPPVGRLRFKPPVRKRAWTSVFDATKPGCVCPQTELYYSRKEMDEDCLNFNIYTPANCQNKSLPVVFYIHGGDYKLQSGNAKPTHGPQLLISQDVVVVTMNYRLGALGFLSLCNEEVPGNAGVKDILLLLTIIQKDVSKFGGDPKKVTVIGNGAGAGMAQMLMLTNECDGLFHKVMLIGGSVLSPEFLQLYPRRNAKLLSRELGLKSKNDIYLLRELRDIDPFVIVEAQKAIEQRDPRKGFRRFSLFKPTVEIPNRNAIITRSPLELMKKGAILNIPILMGFNDQEGIEMFPTFRREPELIDILNCNFDLSIPSDIQYPQGSVERSNLADRIRAFYFNGGNISLVTVQNYINLISDSKYTYAIDHFIKLFNDKKTAPVYYFLFAFDGSLNWFKKFFEITYPGAAHSDQIGYIFLTHETKCAYKNLDSLTSNALLSGLLNIRRFVYYGAPTPNALVRYWPEAGRKGFHLRQGIESDIIFHRPIPKRIEFWNETYEEYFSSKWGSATYFCTNESV